MSQEQVWNEFFSRQHLTEAQQLQFRDYYTLLIETNRMHNITAITDLPRVINDHFEDSLALRELFDCSKLKGLGDIGTGAGFPALPLKIVYPDLPLFLLEVQAKKRAFLRQLCDYFHFSSVTISELDWRTFLRQTNFEIDLFCARASLQPEELVRAFMSSSPYKHSQVVYWASQGWIPSDQVEPYVDRTVSYSVGAKQRKLILLASSK
jgi:16S rRNA (guanine(527)-N(7))-methyltransferase RsmG